MPLLVTSASGVNGNGFGTLLAFGLDGKLRGTLIDDERIVDPRGLVVDPKENLLFLNSGADRVLAISPPELIVRDTGRIEGLNPGGGTLGPDGRYYVGSRTARTIIALSTSLDANAQQVLPPKVVPFPRGFAFGHDGRLFLASGIGPNGEGDNSILAFAPGVSPAIRPTRFVSDPELSPLDLAIAPNGNIVVSTEHPFAVENAVTTVREYDAMDGHLVRVFSPNGKAEFRKPRGLRFAPNGILGCVARDEVVSFDFVSGKCLGAMARLPRLTCVTGQLDNPTIVALTATPPYDVSPFEWQRYEELCGPVDAEVSVPELVLEGDLCPHQDYVYFSTPTEKEQKVISDFRTAVDSFVERLRSNAGFKDAILTHLWIATPDDHTEEILEDPEYLSSMVVFLHAAGREIPHAVLKTLGLSHKQVPALELEWLEVLLSHCLYSDVERFQPSEQILKLLRRELLEIGAIERRRVKLRDPSDHLKLLTTSITKLKSIEEIVRLESASQCAELRCVILTDFIRKAEMPKSKDELAVCEDIGIVPIFEYLRRAALSDIRLGVLSGSLVIIPSSAESLLRQAATALGIEPRDLSISPLSHDPGYSSVEIRGQYYRGSVRLITSVFQQGGITVLVGTKSLLGEGWDAPCINTLLLASFVGSFVLSNQMRGRSIRVDSAQTQKTANIWHLVCVEPGLFGPGDDYELLVRRCSAFAGVNSAAPVIENGTERLGFGHPPFSRDQIAQINTQTCKRALDRAGLRQQWQDALGAGSIKQMTDGLKAPDESLPRGFVLTNTIAALLIQAAYIIVAILEYFGRMLGRVRTTQEFWTFAALLLGIAAIVSLPWSLIALWRFIRHGTPERSIKQIGRAVLEALEYEGSIDQHAGVFRVYADRNGDGTVFCWMGGTGKEQATFLRALREILSPFDNPRYLLARRKIWRVLREDYFAVPDALARKKEVAEMFTRRWKRLVGPVDLVYTRTPEGRKALLRARNHSLSGAFQKRAERVSSWK